MDPTQIDFERIMIFEHARITAEAAYAKNPYDADALSINPAKHEALWCLGNAYTANGFLNPDHDEAQIQFDQAAECFQKAVNEAPDLHNEIVKQGVFNQPQPSLGAGPAASSKAKKPANKKSSDLKYDICGWIILAVGIMAWVGMAKSHTPQ
ncbi:putative plant specific mitochondrial import receptor subunit TOM20 [Helianthus annuus]|nr:putative plant specific mitochondrial import receptor subunit TOM20 [Helianthus annuus]KAJ0823782.1 putative plant specific mitochondrial import receptor subunit TOM20 [Helianthus annuus]